MPSPSTASLAGPSGTSSPSSSSSSGASSAGSSSRSPGRRTSSNGNSIKNGGTRSHVCHTCGMSFNRLLHLQRHEYRHGDSRPFVCSVCPKSFTRQDSLVRHARLHMRGPGGSGKLELPKKVIKACMKCTETTKCKRCSAVGKRNKGAKQAAGAAKAPAKKLAAAKKLTVATSGMDAAGGLAGHIPFGADAACAARAAAAAMAAAQQHQQALSPLRSSISSMDASSPSEAAYSSAWSSADGGVESDSSIPTPSSASFPTLLMPLHHAQYHGQAPPPQRMRSESLATTHSSLFSSLGDDSASSGLLSPLSELSPLLEHEHSQQQQHQAFSSQAPHGLGLHQQLHSSLLSSAKAEAEATLALQAALGNWAMAAGSTGAGAHGLHADALLTAAPTPSSVLLPDLSLHEFQWGPACLDLSAHAAAAAALPHAAPAAAQAAPLAQAHFGPTLVHDPFSGLDTGMLFRA